MRDETTLLEAMETQSNELYYIFHNLRLAEQCFRHLLESMDCDTEVDVFISDARVDYDGLTRLCAVNIELASRVSKALKFRRRLKAPDRPTAALVRDTGDEKKLNRLFRESLVDLMVLSVQCWEQCTGKSRIELAEESRIWCVNVDEGRLRVRSMDRYLGINKLPKKPRWRDVVRTAYFVLEHGGESALLEKLEEALEHTLSLVRRLAL